MFTVLCRKWINVLSSFIRPSPKRAFGAQMAWIVNIPFEVQESQKLICGKFLCQRMKLIIAQLTCVTWSWRKLKTLLQSMDFQALSAFWNNVPKVSKHTIITINICCLKYCVSTNIQTHSTFIYSRFVDRNLQMSLRKAKHAEVHC